jgi:hypothetical protein
MDKSVVVAADDDPGSCNEAPEVTDRSRHDRNGGGAVGKKKKIIANSARVSPTTGVAFLAAALKVTTSSAPGP